MKQEERRSYLRQAGRLTWEILLRGRHHFSFDLIPMNTSNMPMAKRLNLLKTGANLVYRRRNPWGWPIHMQVELTNYCNLRCPVCPTGTGLLERKPVNMDPILFERLMNEAGPCLLTASLFAWGESLLHPQLADILRIAQKRGVTTILSTNGQNLEDETVVKALISYPPTYLIVCLDGLTDETNSVFRIGARLDTALRGIRNLAQMRHQAGSRLPILHFRYIVMKHNEHEVPELRDFALAHLFDELSIRTLSIIDAADGKHRDLVPRDEVLRAYKYAEAERIGRMDFICEKAFTYPTVFADGTVVSCEQDYNAQHPYGSLADGSSFASLWWSKQAAEVRSTIRDNAGKLSFCRNCPFKDRPISTCSIQYFDLRK